MTRVALRTGTPSLRLLVGVFLMTPVTTREIGESRARFGARAKFASSTDRRCDHHTAPLLLTLCR